MGTVYKRGKKWWVSWYYNCKRNYMATDCSTKTEAKELLKEIEVKHAPFFEKGKIRFKDFTNSWIERRKVYLRPSTYDSYVEILNMHLIPYFGNMQLKDILPSHVESYVYTKKHLSEKTVNKHLAILHNIFGHAVDDRIIQTNPVLRRHRLKEKYFEKIHFSAEEMNRIIENIPEEYKPFFITAWNTGLRLGELIGLRWEDTNFQEEYLTIRRSIYQKHGRSIETPPKSKSGFRKIYMTRTLKDALLNYKENQKILTNLVFHKDGEILGKSGLIRYQWSRALKRTGLPFSSFHSIRHSYITLLRLHFPEHIVRYLAGHSRGSKIVDVYTHISDDVLKDCAIKLEKILNNGRTERLPNIMSQPQ